MGPERAEREFEMLRIYEVALRVLEELRPAVAAIEARDRDLARQMRRAVCSVALNTAEGMGSRGRLRNVRYHSALGSMQETLACVEVGVALGYVEGIDAGVEDRIRRIIGTLVRLIGR